MCFCQGVIPSGAQTVTATLVSGTAKQVCATVLLSGVWAPTPTAGGTSASGTTVNPSISISPASAGELAFAVMGIRGTTAPTAVTGTGATATSLYGIAPTQCTSAPSTSCGAGADMPFPGTAITWTDGNATDWVVSAVRVLPTPNCGAASGNCYRIGAGGTWATGANWSNTSGGAACGCTPVATNNAIFNATPTGTTTLAAATTIASIDMTNFTGTLDTTASNWGLTVNGPFAIQGTLLARNSTIVVTGDVVMLTAGTIVNLGASAWTINGLWTNLSTSASWVAGTSTVTIRDAASGTLTFAALSVGNGGILTANASTVTASSVAMTGGTSGTITLTTSSFTSTGNWDTSGAGSVFTKGTSTVTMSGVANIAILNASNNFNNLVISAAGTVTQSGLVDVSGTLTVNGGSVLASGTFTLTVATLAANMAGGITAGAAGTKTITGNVSIAAAGYFSFGAATWNFGGSWTNSSTSGSWSVGTGTVVFNSGSSRTMTFANLGVSEFNNVQFSPTAAATFTMVTNGLRWGGTLTLNNNATLSTGNLALTGSGGNLTVNNGATLTAGTSVVSATNVTMTGGTSGAITASGSWTVSGNWDTSGAGSVLTAALSTVTLSGTAKTVRILNASNGFGALTISGTVSASSAITLSALLTVSGTFDTTATNYGLSIGGGLTVSGVAGILRSNGSTVSVAGNVSVNNGGGYITSGP